MKPSSIIEFTPKSNPVYTQSLSEGIAAERATKVSTSYSGDRKVLIDAFDASLRKRTGADVGFSSIEHYTQRLFSEDAAFNADLPPLAKKQYTAQAVPRKVGLALRDAVKALAVYRFKQKAHFGAPEGVSAIVPHAAKLHASLVESMVHMRNDNILFFDNAVDMPLWETWTAIGTSPAGDTEFQKSEIYTVDDLKIHITTKKFARGLAQWVAAEVMESVRLPVLELGDSAAAELLSEFITKSLESKAKRDKKEGKDVWEYQKFYSSGELLGDVMPKPSLMGVLAFVGRVVQQYNKLVTKANTQIGNAALRAHPSSGLEVRNASIEVLGYYDIDVGFDNHNHENGAIVSNTRKLELDFAALEGHVNDYLDAWKRILHPSELKLLGLAFHGGFSVSEQEVECERGVTKTTTFSAKPCVLEKLDVSADLDIAQQYANEQRLQRAKLAQKTASEFKPRTLTF